ncbi:AmmeMemoRadiSam system protein A [Shewanella psychrophila]|uniref:AmmeMemoRadiSam system protein A n=1 Tax=Shewanella psychrophila TaxID=225848 RepID=A0A1S6HW13_9GAMM|nr:AmmeMemoRadiSam system protein A [Shewanella psychrophila]AQS39689.1 AmmeMemoRadiSam system protein A [Shewanella psychrophila]
MPALSSINLTESGKCQLLALARSALVNSFISEPSAYSSATSHHALPNEPLIESKLGCFVTLTLDGELKGCMGCIEGDRPLAKSIPDLATSSAFYDRRFSPLLETQLERVSIEISLLSPLSPLNVRNQRQLEEYLTQEQYGVVLKEDGLRAVFLPQVWEHFSDPKAFIDALKVKGGWPQDYWSQKIKVELFQVIHFSENR